jgi:hypothetical protein
VSSKEHRVATSKDAILSLWVVAERNVGVYLRQSRFLKKVKIAALLETAAMDPKKIWTYYFAGKWKMTLNQSLLASTHVFSKLYCTWMNSNLKFKVRGLVNLC